MNIQSTFDLRSFRVLIVTIGLALATTVGFAASDVSADVLMPARDIGAPGGGGGFAEVAEEAAELAPQAIGPQVRPL